MTARIEPSLLGRMSERQVLRVLRAQGRCRAPRWPGTPG